MLRIDIKQGASLFPHMYNVIIMDGKNTFHWYINIIVTQVRCTKQQNKHYTVSSHLVRMQLMCKERFHMLHNERAIRNPWRCINRCNDTLLAIASLSILHKIFYVMYQHSDGMGSWNLSSQKTWDLFSCIFHTMVIDILVTQEARVPADMASILWYL